jgi:hypothetical protein
MLVGDATDNLSLWCYTEELSKMRTIINKTKLIMAMKYEKEKEKEKEEHQA